MKCKSCKNEIPDGSLFCMFCGNQIHKRREKKKEVSVPKPRKLDSGKWYAQMMVAGEMQYITTDTEQEYYAKARAIKTGLLEAKKASQVLTLRDACKQYIERRDSILSPSTIKGYKNIARFRFQDYMDTDIHKIDYKKMVNDEAAEDVSPKTLKSSWGFIKSVLKENNITPPSMTLPQLVPKELPWLQPEQIPKFLQAIKGQPCEMGALFALHGLRRSEILALTPADIQDGYIIIKKAVVHDIDNNVIYKSATKNVSSNRKVKIRIPRLQELINNSKLDTDRPYCENDFNSLYTGINAACRSAGLPEVGVHGLRRTFASLAYSLGWSQKATMKEGGWSDNATMNKVYIKLAESDLKKSSDSMENFYANL